MILAYIGFLVSVCFLLFFGLKVENLLGQIIIVILSAILIHVFFYLDSHLIESRRNSEGVRK